MHYPVNVFVGKIRDYAGSRPSAIDKIQVDGELQLGDLGLDGDQQAEKKIHGGPDRALCHYPREHYADWIRDFPQQAERFCAPAFGENLSTTGLTEQNVYIGDIFRWGEALIQVTQPRSPCFKLNFHFAINDMAQLMQNSGKTGWLYRVIAGGQVLFTVLFAISLIGMSELYKVFGIEKKAPGIVGYIFAFGYYALIYMEEYLPGEKHTWFMLLFMAYLICQMAVLVFSYPKYNTQQIMAAFFGVFYVAVMLSYIYLTRMLPGGVFTVWLVFICSWGCDTCAYCVGMLIGKHKMAPVLSPKKSVEGGIGGIAGAALIGVLYALAVNHWGNAGASIVSYAVIGAVGGAISQIGDLAASAIKRYHNIKDYGKLIPGHGGILDRFDSVIFTAPIIYYLAVLL